MSRTRHIYSENGDEAMTSLREVLAIMARYPEEGKAKTRLARDLGPHRTCRLYRAFLYDLADKFGYLPRPLIWYFVPESSPFSQLFSHRFFCRPQSGTSLQERMLRIFEDLFREGYTRAVVIGSDVPHIPVKAVDEAFDALNEFDVVVRPSTDGGYHLVGLKAVHDLFSGISMGTPWVLRDTIERAFSMGLSTHCLDPSFDIDTLGDIRQLMQFLAERDESLPRTREVLAEIL